MVTLRSQADLRLSTRGDRFDSCRWWKDIRRLLCSKERQEGHERLRCVVFQLPYRAAMAGMSRRFAIWLMPDVAMTFASITLICLFCICNGATSLFGDSDTGWHIRNGERVLATKTLPHTDPYSFSKAGAPWIAWEWGSDVVMARVYRAGGMGGVALLFGLCIAASIWMWFRLHRVAWGNLVLAGLFFFPALPVMTLHWLARPHIFSWLFLLGAVWFCERLPERLRWWHFAFVFAASAIWANLHASFFLGVAIAWVYGLGEFLRPWIWQGETGERSFDFLLAGIAALLGSFVNPNGWGLHRHVIAYLSNSALLGQITEFQSFDFHQDGAWRVMVMLMLCLAGAFASLADRRPARFLLAVLLAAIALQSIRGLPVAALLLLPLANGSITQVFRQAKGLTPALRRATGAVLNYGDGLLVFDRRFRGYAMVPAIAVLVFLSIRSSAGFPASEFPVSASSVIDGLPADARILAPDTFGGYLIYRFSGARKVLMDGRSDFYGSDFLKRYLVLVSARPGWREEFNRWGFTYALLPPECSLLEALEGRGWREVYRDQTAVILSGSSKI